MSPLGPHIDPEQCDRNAAPYVLGALTEEEHEAFCRHIESCAVCREEVAALQMVASALPAAAPQVSAPPELKRRVMTDVYASPARRDADQTTTSGPIRHGGAARDRATRTISRWLAPRSNFAVLALTAAAIVLAIVVISSSGGGSTTRVFHAKVLVPHASAFLSVTGSRAELEIAGMPQAGPGRVYEVWRKGSGEPHPTDALFTVSSPGGDATVGVPGGVTGVREVLVTSEPEGGSLVPTRSPVVVARVG